MIAAIATADSYQPQKVNRALDCIFRSLGLNPECPFKGIIKPGMTVFIKPNWVASRWRESCPHRDNLYCGLISIISNINDIIHMREHKGKIAYV